MPVSGTHRGERLDAEEEIAGESGRIQISAASRDQVVEEAKQQVKADEEGRQRGE